MTATRRPDRVLGGEHDRFWEYCASDELWLQRCQECTLVQWPSVADGRCERCAGRAPWQRMSGHGTIINWCTFERAYYPQLAVPYDTVLVELDEGALFISNPWGFGTDAVSRGLGVSVTFIDCMDDHGPFRLPVFGPRS